MSRKANSEVVYENVDGEYLFVAKAENLANWENSPEGFAFERVIGIYANGDTSCLPALTSLIFNKQDPYSKENKPYLQIEENKIKLSSYARQWFVNFKHTLVKGKSVLMNHYESGGECIGETLNLEKGVEKMVEIEYKGLLF